MPHITGTVHRVPVKTTNSTIWKQVKLADTLPTEGEDCTIDILIGSDYYWDFVTSEKMEVSPGLFLIGSKLGMIVTGRTGVTDKNCPSTTLFTHTTIKHATILENIDEVADVLPQCITVS